VIARRAFIAAMTGSLLAAPLAAEAQQAGKVYRIGWLWDSVGGPARDEWLAGFRQGLRERDLVEGRNVVVEWRSGHYSATREENLDRLRQLAEELVRLKVDVLVAAPAGAAVAARRATATVPIVFPGVSDPVGFGLVASLAQPGGNATGLSYLSLELNAKRLQLLKETLPRVTRVGVLVDLHHPLQDRMVREIEAAARPLRIELHVQRVGREVSDIEAAFDALEKEQVAAVIGLQGPQFIRERRRVAELALRHRLPGIFELVDFAEAGALMAYAPNTSDLFRRAAHYVERILKGAKPANLPVEQPTKFELVINLKTAKALGLTIPQSLLLRAAQVIE
jgi:putative ABC transport system substrate-binding protein